LSSPLKAAPPDSGAFSDFPKESRAAASVRLGKQLGVCLPKSVLVAPPYGMIARIGADVSRSRDAPSHRPHLSIIDRIAVSMGRICHSGINQRWREISPFPLDASVPQRRATDNVDAVRLPLTIIALDGRRSRQ
jgi:hypothetical protein